MALLNQSNLPTNQDFKFENYPDAPEWFKQFLSSLNLFVGPVYNVLNGGVNYQNLTIPKLFTKAFTTPASGLVTFNFPNPLRINPSAVLIGNLYEGTSTSVHPTDATIAYWHLSQNVIYIDDIPNLTAATGYSVTFVIL
jgi:hypothetical protein